MLMFMLRATLLVVRRTLKTNGARLHHTTLPVGFNLSFPYHLWGLLSHHSRDRRESEVLEDLEKAL